MQTLLLAVKSLMPNGRLCICCVVTGGCEALCLQQRRPVACCDDNCVFDECFHADDLVLMVMTLGVFEDCFHADDLVLMVITFGAI